MFTSANNITNQRSTVISLPNTTLYLSPDVAHFRRCYSNGWWCNLCSDFKLRSSHPHQMVVKQNKTSQFDIMVKLIKNQNCEVIFYDCELSQKQSAYLNNLVKSKNIRLVNARELQLPNQKIA